MQIYIKKIENEIRKIEEVGKKEKGQKREKNKE